jgi:hypothetical protein
VLYALLLFLFLNLEKKIRVVTRRDPARPLVYKKKEELISYHTSDVNICTDS